MAKRGVPEHPKTRKLARVLGAERWAAVGLLECLWHWCSRFAVTGEIPYDAAEIADGINYEGDPEKLLDALIDCKWLDRCEHCNSLYIHDIADHADNTWKATLKRQGKDFVRCNCTESQSNHDLVATESQSNHIPPNQTKPNQTKPQESEHGSKCKSPAKNGNGTNRNPDIGSAAARFPEFWAAIPRKAGESRSAAEGMFISRVTLDGADPDAIINGAKRIGLWYKSEGTDPKFYKSVMAFLNAEDKLWLEPWEVKKPASQGIGVYGLVQK